MKLLCIDSNSILNRAFYGIKLLTTKDGAYTNAVYGYMNIFKKLLDEVQPDAVACCFDLPAPTFRHQRYEGYKAQRKGMPEELAAQLPLVKELLGMLGYRIVTLEGYEADDLLGTFARRCRQAGDSCVIATGDRDSLQLVSDFTTVLLASTKGGRPATTVVTPAYIRETYGVEPRQLIDVKALMGDTSDNIPGVPGIGEKGALRLIQEHGSLEALYAGLEGATVSPKLKEKLLAGRELAFMSRELAEICCDAPLPVAAADCAPGEPDYPAAHALLARLEMFTMIERLGIPAGAAAAAPPGEAPLPDKPPVENDYGALGALLAGPGPADLLCAAEGDDISAFAIDTPERLYVYTCEAVDFRGGLRRALTAEAPLRTSDSKLLHRYALQNGFDVGRIAFDAGLAGYLLSPNATDYGVPRLLDTYGVPVPPAAHAGPAGAQGFGELCMRLQQEIGQNGLAEVLGTIELPLSRVLASMELTGFQVDAAGIEAFGAVLDSQLAALEGSICRRAGEDFNINSPKQLGAVLFEKLGLPARRKNKSGYSTDAEVLESLADYHPIVAEILEYRKLVKLKGTYVEGLLKVVGPDGRIHSSFKQTETRTGRISSTDPNMQNIPVRTELGSTMRRFFTAKEGCVLVDADYSQIELRVLAHIAGDRNMLAAFETGADIHTQTAAQVFGIPPELVTPQMRSRAKAVNFGIVYGIGAFSLSKDIGVSVAEADRYIKSYLATYSGVDRYMHETVEKAARDGYVTTLFGRRRYLPELASRNKNIQAFGRRVAMNTPIQGTAADIIKRAMIRVFDRLRREGLRSRLILQVHDELIVEAPRDEAPRAGEILREEMENAAQLDVRLQVDVGTGESWYDAK